MESSKPIYGSQEALEQGIEAPKSDAFVVQESSWRLEERLGDHAPVEATITLPETSQSNFENMANRLGGLTLPGEVQDPRT